MSMSTPGPERNPSTVKVDKTTGQGKPPTGEPPAGEPSTGKSSVGKPSAGRPSTGKSPAGRPSAGNSSASSSSAGSSSAGRPSARASGSKATRANAARPGGKGPAGKGGGKGRKPITPVKASGGRNWGPIVVAGVVVLIAAGIIGYGVWAAARSSNEASTPWEERAAAIEGIVNYRNSTDKTITAREHKPGLLTYATNPPVGGDHNPRWENCNGDVYTEPIPKEHAVHSLEHGAVWVTYKQGLAADQVDKLKSKVEGQDYTLMSPIANLDKNVSLQAWGYQLKVDSADDGR
ncbi:MAG TPA: DUF3105 domain-containing protein, partial [Actinoplanes sp.]|nr:DUF3105 domain-containing protein [Actinoplanes sp.]